ncbi:Luc7-like protein 3 [Gossypium arboreum]|uniref:Luc7-like protein 3 n=1 Tax=Gossypium arboreum TaxID=29729 RepID=A0A0B0MKK3_GOSAR|nr:Luc7-like protein 3 [Gossypium arboreum]
MDAQRALLDELMGTARNLTDEEKKGYREIRWDDKEVCAFYMVRFCPHDLFVNTRSDLGPCPRVHDQKLKESFEKSPRHDAYVPKFEAELAQFCEKLVMDLDRRVRRGRERLAQEVEPAPPAPLSAEKSEQLSVMEEKIKNLLEQVETLGEAGKVDEAEALMRKVEALNAEKTALAQQPQNDKVLMLAQEKKMALCEESNILVMAWFGISSLSSRKPRRKEGKRKNYQERKKPKNGESRGRRNMRVGGEAIQVIGTNIMIERRTETDIGNVIWIAKGLESGMGEVFVMERGIGGTGMAEMEAGIDTGNAAGPIPPVDIVAGGPQEVQFTDISAFCR